ncbi:hypothetical protein GCM10009715_17530 [Paeniglutamicibacter psychrophenolicus]|uniref:DUF2339 domain-containing protein n=1 Tax=Paeniglutamicibacter psychrophenolicus TaxID=257454 RepID=A0ABS4WCS2_9MICC|nr:hypothetical protein [Paeniglutamicibacter psychrophenolicus]MBP2373997.1 hypothetical protein [Paeniglutamicibacter psychrophenolicus]
MNGFVLIVVAVAMFLAGLFLGKQLAANKFQSRQPAQAPAPDRAALALAWQRGFDAATQEAARKRETGDALVPQDAQTGAPGPALGEQGTSTAGSMQPGPAAPVPFAPTPSAPPAAVGDPGPGSGQPQYSGAMPAATHVGQPAMPAPPPRVPAVPVDPRVRALRNINITLYVAALLMVAAASLFIALALPAAAKVVGLGLVAAGFYGVGLLMHARSVRLRPAAAAFTATGLALIPMTGLAHFLLLSTTPGASWFVTSVVGTVAFAYAAGKLQSRIVAGLGTTFLVSTAYSGGAVLNRGLIYYFLFSMLLATAITLVGARKPRWVGNIYVQSFALAHRYLVPATVLAALLSFAVLQARDYGWIFAAAALYYAVALIAAPATERFAHLAAARISAMASIGAFLHVADVSATDIFRIMAALLVAQLVLLAQFAPNYARKLRLKQAFATGETWILLALAGLGALMGAESLLRDPGLAGSGGGLDLNWALALLLAAGVFVGARRGGNFRWVPLGVAVLGIVEPMDGNQGRQGILLAAAVLATWWLARNASGTARSSLRWAARIASVPATGALFSYAAAGWALQPRFGSTLTVLPGTANPAQAAALERTIEVATLVGVVLALLIQLCVAAALLSRMRRTAQTAAATAPRLESFGESLIFAGGVLCAAVATWSLSMKLGWGGSLLYSDVDPGTAGFATVLWLGYQWDTILLWMGLLAGLVGATAILGHRRAPHRIPGERTGAVLEGVPMALGHLGGLAALGAGLGMAAGRDPSWMVELVAVLGLAHVGIRILAGTGLAEKVGYSVLAQALFSGTAWHIADRFDMDAHGQFALFAFTIALAQSVRAALGRKSAMPKYSDPRTLMTLAAVALLLLVPAVYLMDHAGGYDQAGLLVQFLCLLAFSGVVVTTHVRRAPAFRYVAVPAALGLLGLVLVPALGQSLRLGGWLPTPLWTKDVAGTVLVLLLLGILVSEVRNLAGKDWRWVRAVVAVVYWAALFGLHDWQEPGWQVTAGLLGAAGFMVFSATWGIPLLLLGSAALVLLASLRGVDLIHDLALERGSEPLDGMIGLGATWVILLIASIFGGRFGGDPVPFAALVRRTAGWDPAHARVLFAASLAALGFGGLLGQSDQIDRHVYAGAVMLLVAVFAAAALEVPARLRETGYEVAALMGAAVIHRCWWVGVGGTSAFAAFYYWIIVLGLLAAYEFRRKRERNGIVVLGASSVLLSLAGLGTFLSSTLAQQLVVLLTFTALLVFGLVTNRKIFTVWGAVGVAVAVLWFLRGYTFLLLLLIAAGLIALALWRLGKMNKGSQDHDSPAQPYPPAAAPAAWQAPAADPSVPDQTVYGPTGPQAPPAPPAGSGMPWMRPHGQDASDDSH